MSSIFCWVGSLNVTNGLVTKEKKKIKNVTNLHK
jgi:hypothetical protein